MKIFVALVSIAVIFIVAATATQNENEAEMQKLEELASEEAEVQSALEQALIQSALEDGDEADLQNILAETEQDTDDDDLNRAQLLKLIASMQSPETRAHIQRWRWRKIWKGAKRVISWIG